MKVLKMKKGAIEIEKLVAFAIALVVFGVIIFGFTRIWGDGEDTTDDMMDYEDEECEDGMRHPVTGECLALLLFCPKIFKKLKKRMSAEL